MPTPEPDGPLNVPLHVAAQMVAATAAWRTACGLAAGDATAEEKLLNGNGGTKSIYYPALEMEDMVDHLPAVVLTWGDEWMLDMQCGGERNFLPFPEGSIGLLIGVKNDSDDIEAAARSFGNLVGLLAKQLGEQAAADDKLSIHTIRQVWRPALCPREEQVKLGFGYWTAGLSLEYAV